MAEANHCGPCPSLCISENTFAYFAFVDIAVISFVGSPESISPTAESRRHFKKANSASAGAKRFAWVLTGCTRYLLVYSLWGYMARNLPEN